MDHQDKAQVVPSTDVPSAQVVWTLCQAASTNDLITLRELVLGQGVDPNSADYDKRTALHLAASEGHAASVKFLLENGANVNARDRWAHTPLDDAVRHRHVAVETYLRTKKARVGEHQQIVGAAGVDYRRDTSAALCTAASHNDVDRLKELVVWQRADVNVADYDGRTALHLAASEGHVESIQFLVDRNARINARDRWQNTPLDDSTRHRHPTAEEYLLSKGARRGAEQLVIDAFDAAVSGDVAALKGLYHSGLFDLNAPQADGSTPLHCAAGAGHLEVVKFLVRQTQAPPAPVDSSGLRPIDIAFGANHEDIVSFLRTATAEYTRRRPPTRAFAVAGLRRVGVALLVAFVAFKLTRPSG